MRRFLGLILLAALASGQAITASAQTPSPATAAAGPELLTTPALVERLREGGAIILIRHERTEVPSREDDFSRPRTDCLSQRNLSASGHAGARETGETFRILGIEVTEVRTSPICRTMDTARLMFGQAIPDERLMHDDPPNGRSGDQADREMRALVSTIDLSRGNVALVTHGGNIQQTFGVTVPEGGIVVLTRDDHGALTVVGRTTGSALDFPARAAVRNRPSGH